VLSRTAVLPVAACNSHCLHPDAALASLLHHVVPLVLHSLSKVGSRTIAPVVDGGYSLHQCTEVGMLVFVSGCDAMVRSSVQYALAVLWECQVSGSVARFFHFCVHFMACKLIP
jgi:hypothetical protein